MLAEERRFRISEILSAQRTVTAADLCAKLSVAAATVRRDLAVLERSGVLVRSHGGAVSKTSSTNFQAALEAQMRSNRSEKQAIAQLAETLVLDGETLFLEGSTTVLELARLLVSRNRLTVVTNSPAIVMLFHRSIGATVLCTGGELQKDIGYLSGHWAQRSLSEVRVDKTILGISAIDSAYGMSTPSHNEAQIKKMLIGAAKVRIGLADNSKFGKQCFAHVGPVTELTHLVTDWDADPAQLASLREQGVDVLVATRGGKDAVQPAKS
jgi:DeoR/GlpR family transcriptional regulator of sugar metabolism